MTGKFLYQSPAAFEDLGFEPVLGSLWWSLWLLFYLFDRSHMIHGIYLWLWRKLCLRRSKSATHLGLRWKSPGRGLFWQHFFNRTQAKQMRDIFKSIGCDGI